ncbi:hypothetical protein HETIRDRAFT_173181 [Heterobasidion irregulare TC 32-1]|uniref:Uncharacterized protein n=1 Tax=Heterobasidion irregulare (strain TC 32-1) TaxID=747525 RepID=W4K6Y3_HETIT|nr:uncharacterized protein HETIRDRAFT_173181 [Heterobasidion irregulare TC 32-1]ETW81509.1 hypothetical protein HETIRDRAFT_173181 [Heterobasidion irregulare TC 32-1]
MQSCVHIVMEIAWTAPRGRHNFPIASVCLYTVQGPHLHLLTLAPKILCLYHTLERCDLAPCIPPVSGTDLLQKTVVSTFLIERNSRDSKDGTFQHLSSARFQGFSYVLHLLQFGSRLFHGSLHYSTYMKGSERSSLRNQSPSIRESVYLGHLAAS